MTGNKHVVVGVFITRLTRFPLHFAPKTAESWCSWGLMVLGKGLSLWKNVSDND